MAGLISLSDKKHFSIVYSDSNFYSNQQRGKKNPKLKLIYSQQIKTKECYYY